MQGEFEKQVKQKMEELKLVPSEPVWHKVEAEINKKRERRRILFFLFLLSATVGILWFTLGHKNGAHTTQNITAQNKIVTPSTNTDTRQTTITHTNVDLVTTTTVHKDNSIDAPFDKLSKTSPLDRMTTSKHREISSDKPSERNTSDKMTSFDRLSEKSPLDRMTKTKAADDKPIKTNNPSSSIISNMPVAIQKDTSLVDKQLASEQKPITKSVTDPVVDNSVKENKGTLVEVKHTEVEVKNTDSVVKKKVAGTRKWQKMIIVQAGLSGYSNNSIANSNLYFSSPSTVTGSGFGSSVGYAPNKTTPGTSFAVGLGVSKILSARFQVNAGVQFHYYTTHIKTGPYTDSVMLASGFSPYGYYPNASTNEYTNYFSMIEIPVSFQYQPFNIPLKVSLGAVYGKLLHSNALTYDASANKYYYDNNNINGNYFSLFSALQYDVMTKDKFTLRAGPTLQYHLTPIEKANYYSLTRLFFAGLKTDIIF